MCGPTILYFTTAEKLHFRHSCNYILFNNCNCICGIRTWQHLIVTGAGFETILFHFKTNIMNSNAILSSDLLDILFENRNKTYGAYNLRKFYPNRVKTSLLIMTGLAVTFSAFTLLPDKKVVTETFTIQDSLLVRHVELEKKVEPPKQTTPPAVAAPTQKFTSTVAFVPEKDSADVLHNLTDMQIGSMTVTHVDPGPPSVGPAEGPSAEPVATEPVVDNNTPVNNPDVQASFPGGEAALINFLQKNLRSPQDIEAGESIQVRIKYVVDFDGNLQSFDVIQDGGSVFNNEVIRVLKKMPKWNPGKKGGRNVPVYYSLPVKFTSAE